MSRSAITLKRFRSRDVYVDDVVKTRLGSFAVVEAIVPSGKYVDLKLDNGTSENHRDVALLQVQVES